MYCLTSNRSLLYVLFLGFVGFLSVGCASGFGERPSAARPTENILLWPEASGTFAASKVVGMSDGGQLWVSKVLEPSMVVSFPSEPSAGRAAIVVCPGGGYSGLSWGREGLEVARWLNSLGIVTGVVAYRLPEGGRFDPVPDVERAIQTFRAQAEAWDIDPKRIGLLGFSAGGHLASLVATSTNREIRAGDADPIAQHDKRPNFLILISAVNMLEGSDAHVGVRDRLLGLNVDGELAHSYTIEARVGPDSPPTFLAHAADDRMVVPEHSLRLFEALRKRHVPSELHVFESGGHGLEPEDGGDESPWKQPCVRWMRDRSLVQ